jgi:hypothetical protein
MLRCEECGREVRASEDARGWRAVLTSEPADDLRGHADDEVRGVAIYCPQCAEREFG